MKTLKEEFDALVEEMNEKQKRQQKMNKEKDRNKIRK